MINVATMLSRFAIFAFVWTGASSTSVTEHAALNPIRKVVNLLQAMQKKVTEEGQHAEELHQKFMCYCSNSGGALSASISAAEAKIPTVGTSVKAAAEQKAQLETDLKAHQGDRAAALAAMKEATALRAKEKAAFDKSTGDNQQNVAAINKAVQAIEHGMAGSFLQSSAAATLRALMMAKSSMLYADRQDVLSFLDGTQQGGYAPASGEIVGILKQMADEMSADTKSLVAAEESAISAYEGLMAAKKKEVAALTRAFETKTKRVGELGVAIATMQNDLEDTKEGLAADQQFAADLKGNCANREAVHEKEKQMRAQEIVALTDTIKILNDDDALELFKKTLPSASASFMQVQESSMSRKMRAEALLENPRQHRFDFVLLALRGRKVGFEKIISMIDGLISTLNSEQEDDLHKKEYCEAQLDSADDKRKQLQNSLSDLATVIEEAKEGIATLAEEIAALKAGIASLDKAVAEATSQRQAEAADFKGLSASNAAAKELILFAKNRLQKFYDPRLYKAAPKVELSAGDRIYENEGGEIVTAAPGGIAGTGITALVQTSSNTMGAPPPPPPVAAAYMKKSDGSAGVISMMDLLVADLDKQTTEAQTDEKNAVAEYEKAMAEAAAKRRQDSKSLTDKEAAHADLVGSLQDTKADRKATAKELMGTMKFISSLKAECDWLLQNFDVRKKARSGEIDSLQQAKAVLSGADYSLVQRRDAVRVRKFLRA